MVKSVSNQQPQQPSRGRIFLSALSQTALTAGVGAAGGAGVGALVSTVVQPGKEKILAQYTDAFLQAATDEGTTNTLRNLVSNASSDTFEHAKTLVPALQARHSAALISSMSEDVFKEIKSEQFQALGLKEGSYASREIAIEELCTKTGAETGVTLQETVEKMGKKVSEVYEGFVAKAKESFEALSKESELYKLSKKSAKSTTRKSMVGKGIKIGIVVALLGSFVLGFIASRKAKKQAAAMQAAAQNQASAQEQLQITPEQAQMMAQMMAQQQSAASQIPVQAQSAMPQMRPLEAQQTAQMPMPQPPTPQQTAPGQKMQDSTAQYFKTPMQSPLI